MFRIIFIFIVFLSSPSFAEKRLGPDDYKELVNLGYNKGCIRGRLFEN